MKSFGHFAATVICILFGFGVSQGLAQAFDFSLGYYSGINTNAKNLSLSSSNSSWITERKPAYGFGLHFRSFLLAEKRSRLGIKLYFHSAKSKPADPQKENDALRAGVNWKMFSMLLSYQRIIFYRTANALSLVSDFSGGFSFFSSSLISGLDYCDSPFCNFPNVRVNVGPGLLYMQRVYDTFALQIGSRYNLFLGENSDGTPFHSGFLFGVGLALEAKRR
jgi:hypothetical protein